MEMMSKKCDKNKNVSGSGLFLRLTPTSNYDFNCYSKKISLYFISNKDTLIIFFLNFFFSILILSFSFKNFLSFRKKIFCFFFPLSYV